MAGLSGCPTSLLSTSGALAGGSGAAQRRRAAGDGADFSAAVFAVVCWDWRDRFVFRLASIAP